MPDKFSCGYGEGGGGGGGGGVKDEKDVGEKVVVGWGPKTFQDSVGMEVLNTPNLGSYTNYEKLSLIH